MWVLCELLRVHARAHQRHGGPHNPHGVHYRHRSNLLRHLARTEGFQGGLPPLQVRLSAPAPDAKPLPIPINLGPGRAEPCAGGLAWGIPATGGSASAAADSDSPIATGAALQGLYGGSLAENLAAVEETLRAEGYLLTDLPLGSSGSHAGSAPAAGPAWHTSIASCSAPLLASWGLPAGSAG